MELIILKLDLGKGSYMVEHEAILGIPRHKGLGGKWIS